MDIQRKNSLAEAILLLEQLIASGDKKEAHYQEYFETYPIVFEILGYTEYHTFTKASGKSLPRDEFSDLKPEPDFIVKNNVGIYEIFEIKTPLDKKLLITHNKYRERFTAEISSYISQTIAYGNYFTRNPQNRQKVHKMYGISIQEEVPQKIIIGLDKNIDKEKIHLYCNRFKDRIDIITYDHILKELKNEYQKNYGQYEGLNGFSLHCIVQFDRAQKHDKSYLIDIGNEVKRNRISVYINRKDEICFEVISNNFKMRTIKIDGDEINIFNEFKYLTFEFGIMKKGYYLSILVNSVEYDKLISTLSVDIDFTDKPMLLGIDITKEKSFKGQMGTFALYDKTNTYREKYFMIDRMQGRFQTINFHGGGEHALIKRVPFKM